MGLKDAIITLPAATIVEHITGNHITLSLYLGTKIDKAIYDCSGWFAHQDYFTLLSMNGLNGMEVTFRKY